MPTKLSFQDRRILEDALCDTPPFLTAQGRQALVRDTIGGYPLSEQVEKSLHWVNWEGECKLVAGNLIKHLEGHEVASGVPALALIAEAIERMAGAGHQARLADLRRRMGWAPPTPVAVDPQPPAPPAAFLISYASADIAAARQLFNDLQTIAPDAVAWFDKSALRPGDDWDPVILQAIRGCLCFLPLLSRQTEALTEGYFRKEWREAAERSKGIQGRKFLFPIVIDPDYDGTMSRYRLVPDEFKAVQYSHAPAGKMDDALKTELTDQFRRLRSEAARS